MLISRSLVIAFSLVLCCSLLFQQADQTYAADYDVPTLVDIPHLEADSNFDFNEPLLITQSLSQSYVFVEAVKPVLQAVYFSLAAPPLLRPPVS